MIRRESGLEAAMLDGVLTAVLQPHDLATGDIVHLAWSLRQKPGGLPFQPESFVALGHGVPTRRVYLREWWSKATNTTWRTSAAWPGKPLVRRSKDGTELLIDLTDVEGPQPPQGAPSRFAFQSVYEASGYAKWEDLGRLFAPVYASASTIAAKSPLNGKSA